MRIPHDTLKPDTLRRLIEEFVTREGTEYGASDVTLDEKVAAVLSQLTDGSAFLAFDPETETTTLVPARDGLRDTAPHIQLDQFLKREGLLDTGGAAKTAVQGGEVSVNGEVETRRKRKLHHGDTVAIAGRSTIVKL